jgi:hypothetical protein
MKVRFITAALVATAAVALGGTAVANGAPAQPPPTPDTYVAFWDGVANQAFTAALTPPPDGSVISAYVSIAMYDSVMAIEGGYEPFAVDTDAPAGASPEAAVVAAAHAILVYSLPDQQQTILDPAYDQSLSTIPDGQAKDDGLATGAYVARVLIRQRAGDGFRVPVGYIVSDPPIPGVWIPTAPSPPLGTYMPNMTPFSLRRPSQFRPGGPPRLSSRQWARQYNEVKEIGSRTSTTRTAEQTLAARFWGEPPIQQAHGSYRKFILDHSLSIVDASRFMGMTTVVAADALIACFDAKYHYPFWRPITAIRAGDTDGNPDTVGDPSWVQLLPGVPNHPEYPSAHSCLTTATGHVIAKFLGTRNIDFTIPSLTGLGDRHYARVSDLEYEVKNARIWGGIHYRISTEVGAEIGKKVERQVLAHHFHRSR